MAATTAASTSSASASQRNRPKKKNPFDIEYGNETDRYKWTQNETEVTITVPVPEGTRAKDIDVKFLPNHIRVGLKGQKPIIDGPLTKQIIPDDCYWIIEKNNIEITLPKIEKRVWWPSIIPGEATVDVEKIEGASHLDSSLLLRLRREHEEKMALEEKEEEERLKREEEAKLKKEQEEKQKEKEDDKAKAIAASPDPAQGSA